MSTPPSFFRHDDADDDDPWGPPDAVVPAYLDADANADHGPLRLRPQPGPRAGHLQPEPRRPEPGRPRAWTVDVPVDPSDRQAQPGHPSLHGHPSLPAQPGRPRAWTVDVPVDPSDLQAQPGLSSGSAPGSSGRPRAWTVDVPVDPSDLQAQPGHPSLHGHPAQPGRPRAWTVDVPVDPSDLQAHPGRPRARTVDVPVDPSDLQAHPGRPRARTVDVPVDPSDLQAQPGHPSHLGHPPSPRWVAPALPTLPTLLIELQARARARTPLPPFLGSTLRGALGQALRDLACTTRAPTCAGCPLLPTCAYGATWEAGAAAPLGPLDRGADPPRPYTLAWERPAARDSATPCLDRGDPLRFRLALFGPARAHAPSFILAAATALDRGLGPRRARLSLEWARVAALTDLPNQPSARAVHLWADGALAPIHALPDTTLPALVAHASGPLPAARLRLHTPLSLTHEDRPLDQVRLDVLTQRLVERLTRLDLAWGTPAHSPTLPWAELVDLAASVRVLRTHTHWVAFERHGTRHPRAVPMGGLVGTLDLGPVPAPLAALWSAGEIVHLGKQATFGFGRIALRAR
jgi:hypothetical protein